MGIKLHAVPCPGEAHQNPLIDHCGLCTPLWGHVVRNQDPTGCAPTFREKVRFAKYMTRASRVIAEDVSTASLGIKDRHRLAMALAAEFFK